MTTTQRSPRHAVSSDNVVADFLGQLAEYDDQLRTGTVYLPAEVSLTATTGEPADTSCQFSVTTFTADGDDTEQTYSNVGVANDDDPTESFGALAEALIGWLSERGFYLIVTDEDLTDEAQWDMNLEAWPRTGADGQPVAGPVQRLAQAFPSDHSQQQICRRRDTLMCAAAGSLGCEVCTPCQHTDAELLARHIDPATARRAHAQFIAQMRDAGSDPNHSCGEAHA